MTGATPAARPTTPSMAPPNAPHFAEIGHGGLWGFVGVYGGTSGAAGLGMAHRAHGEWPIGRAYRPYQPPRAGPIGSGHDHRHRPAWDQNFLFTMFKSIACYVVRATAGARGNGPCVRRPLALFRQMRLPGPAGLSDSQIGDLRGFSNTAPGSPRQRRS